MALEESGEKNTDPPEEHIYHIRESAFPSSDIDMSNKKCLESRMNCIQGDLLGVEEAKMTSESALQVEITQIAILKPREELAGVTKIRQ